MATHGSVPAPLDARRHVPITAGRRRTRLGSVRATALLRCRKHAVEISASGHGWLSLAVKIKRRCRQSISGGVQGDAGLPPAMGLRNRCVVLAREEGAGQGLARRGESVARRVGGAPDSRRALLASPLLTTKNYVGRERCRTCGGKLRWWEVAVGSEARLRAARRAHTAPCTAWLS